MTYTNTLPSITSLQLLTKSAEPFPATASALLTAAQKCNSSKSTQYLLRLFPGDVVFEDGNDFLTRSTELRMILHEKRKMPAEMLRSPQD